ncbi:MAG TPA: YdeI/OmpD-associated family protein [Ohtaekwangia sp.]
MIRFVATLLKFDKKGEKTGWTFIEISAKQANTMKPGQKVSYRVKGTFDSYSFEKVAMLPMGDGKFIIPINATMRKALGKKQGDKIKVVLEADDKKLPLSADLMACLKDDLEALKFFKSLPPSHQSYFSKWIDGAKTTQTKTRRIVVVVTACSKKQGYGEMMRAYRDGSYE